MILIIGILVFAVVVGYIIFSMALLWHLYTFRLSRDATRWVIPLYEIISLLLIGTIIILYLQLLISNSP